MNKLNTFLSAILAIGLLAGPSLAIDPVTGTKSPDTAAATTYTEDQLVGLNVVNAKGDKIGAIKDVNMNTSTGKINYVILSKGGVLGVGDKEFALPLAALDIRSDEREATLLVTEDKLDSAPVHAVGISDEEYKGRIEEHYGLAPAWEPKGDMPR